MRLLFYTKVIVHAVDIRMHPQVQQPGPHAHRVTMLDSVEWVSKYSKRRGNSNLATACRLLVYLDWYITISGTDYFVVSCYSEHLVCWRQMRFKKKKWKNTKVKFFQVGKEERKKGRKENMGQGVKTRKLNYILMMPQEYWDQGRHYL